MDVKSKKLHIMLTFRKYLEGDKLIACKKGSPWLVHG